MVEISIDEIGRDLPAFRQRIHAGETFVIVESGKPLAEVKPIQPPSTTLRPFGLCAGEFVVPADFDDPLPEDILQEFEG